MSEKVYIPDNFQEDVYFFNKGVHRSAYNFLGSHQMTYDGVTGYQFSVWAPNASCVYLQGDFNDWSLEKMHKVEGGVWTLFQPQARKGHCYKYGVDNGKGNIEYKIDPFGIKFETPPKDATIVWDRPEYDWGDTSWLRSRARRKLYENPIQIYEVHAGSWKHHEDGSTYSLVDLVDSLIPYVVDMGYTHIELMPIMDHPLDASWGYQITGYYAVSGRYGSVDDFKVFVDACHQAGIGVILDWVPGHFCRNANALAYFDGSPTYEYQDVNRANNLGWGALNFDLGKSQVHSFLISNALYWLKEFHVDGIRVDAISSILYLDFDGEPWTPNEDGSNHNREGISFLQKLNTTIKEEVPDALIMAEESTSWEGVTKSVEDGGLGFDYKWNMGWMNDSLEFWEMDPLYRPANLNKITFVFMYQYSERYVLPYSHDEVVHGKNSLLGKLPGDRYNQFAQLRSMQAYMMGQPGKKLNFMGNEIGQFLEWRYYDELEWIDLEREYNKEYQHFVKTLNHLGKTHKALHQLDHHPDGFEVIDANNTDEGVLSFIRRGKNPRDFLIIVCNFVPVQRDNFRLGVPYRGNYEVILNSEMEEFGGSWTQNLPPLVTEEITYNNRPYSLELTIPAQSVLFIEPKRVYGVNK